MNIKIPHSVIVKAPGLLPMLYTSREICEELNLPLSTFRDWFEYGVPLIRDEQNHLWINGQEFSLWIKKQKQIKSKKHIDEDQAYCFFCHDVVKIISPDIQMQKGNLLLIKGKCSICGNSVYKGTRNDKSTEFS